jgi:hypothetical protein
MEDAERRVRQLLARHIEMRAFEAEHAPLNRDACFQTVALVRLWQEAGEDSWDQPEPFGRFDHLMGQLELGPALIGVPDHELLSAAHDVHEAARILS